MGKPDLENPLILWWNENTADLRDRSGGQRGLNIPAGYSFVEVCYAQAKLSLLFRTDAPDGGMSDVLRLNEKKILPITTGIQSAFKIWSAEVESQDGVCGLAANMFEGSMSDALNTLRYYTQEIVGDDLAPKLPDWGSQGIYRLRPGFTKFRPSFLLPPVFRVYGYYGNYGFDPEAESKVFHAYDFTGWGSQSQVDYPSVELVLENGLMNRVVTENGQAIPAFSYLVQFRFYREIED